LQKAKDNDGSLFKLQEKYWVSTVAWSPNGKYLVTASWEPKLRNVHVWNTADRTSAAVFDVSVGDGGSSGSRIVAWSPDSQFLAFCASRPHLAVQIYQSSSWTLVREILAPRVNSCRQLAFSADGRSLAIEGETLLVVDTSTWKSAKEIREIDGRNIRYVAGPISFTREGTLLIAERHWENPHHAVGQVWFLDPQDAVPTRHIEVYPTDPQISDTPISNIAVNPRTGEFAVSGWISRQMPRSYSFRIFSREGKLLAAPLDFGDDAEGEQSGLSYTPDGKLLFVGYRDKEGTVRIVDADRHIVLKTIRTGASIYDLAVSPDGQQLVTSHDFTAAVWSIREFR
jgi:WD40 repeat protein